VSEIEMKMEECLRPILGDMAPIAIEGQKKKLGLQGMELSREQYYQLANQIKEMCEEMAGEVIADKIFKGLMSIINE